MTPIPPKPVPLDLLNHDAFWAKVQRGDDCWLWTASKCGQMGYGQFHIQGRPYLAHRVSWTMAHGEDPGAWRVLHHCDTPLCVRPEHLHRGDDVDNNREMHDRGRWRAGGRVGPRPEQYGEKHWRSKLTNEQAAEIRERYAAGGISQAALAKEFGVAQGQISNITLGRSYR